MVGCRSLQTDANIPALFTRSAPELDNAAIVVKRNLLQHQINRIRIEHFARNRDLKFAPFRCSMHGPDPSRRLHGPSSSLNQITDFCKPRNSTIGASQ